MNIEITLKNYRCFPDSRPARFSVRNGLIALVGANNSGKSSLLKFFFEFRDLFRQLTNPAHLNTSLKNPVAFSMAPGVRDTAEIFHNGNNRDLEIEIQLHVSQPTEALVVDGIHIVVPRNSNTFRSVLGVRKKWADCAEAVVNGDGFFRSSELAKSRQKLILLTDMYEVLRALSQTLYVGPFRNAINVGSKEDYFDIKVGDSFIREWKALKTGNVKRHNETALQLTADIRSIFGFGELQIDASDDTQTLQAIINGKSYKLPEIGSGLTQFILVLANAATKQPSYVLIDEPELNLHPTLQLDFLTTLASYAECGVLFATHSIGLARASGDLIYSLRSKQNGESELRVLETTPRLSEFLGELSFSGYRELGFNQVLLVEGSTEVKTFQQFLRKYRRDHEVVLLQLGGSSTIKENCDSELEEIKRICDRVIAIIDSERDAVDAPLSKERTGFQEACDRAGIVCHVLSRRSLENYFTDAAVKKVKGEKYRALGPFQRREELNPIWAKSENWRIARVLAIEELEGTDLGEFLKAI